MLTDRYGNQLSSTSVTACEQYVLGIDRLLGAEPDIEQAFQAAIEADPDFALAHCALARTRQIFGDGRGAREAMKPALTGTATKPRERAHVKAFDLLTTGQAAAAYSLIRGHLLEYPRDALIAQTCTGVFSLIGFSGLPGRESEQLACTAMLMPHYKDDWWLMSQHAFSMLEAGQAAPALPVVERALELNARNAHGAHIRAHAHYELGLAEDGARQLTEWMRDYDRAGYMHCHNSWHLALWAMFAGDFDKMWRIVDDAVMPGAAWGPALNVLTDVASVLRRTELAGAPVPRDYWQKISQYAVQCFPKPGLAFADLHAALAHAMAGNAPALKKIIDDACGPAGDLVALFARAFDATAQNEWQQVEALLVEAMSDHARLGGSRAQRDLLEFSLLEAMGLQGRQDEARRLLALRRPVHIGRCPVSALGSHPHKEGVIHYYDTHPINEDEILAKLAARGADLENLTQADLKELDQDHYGGLPALETLADAAGISARHHVLDVCSGMGGPARWLANTRGCEVTGLDFTLSRVEAARRLTERVGLSDKVRFIHGDATAMPLAPNHFDVLIAQEGWLHIPGKPKLIAECIRLVKPGGTIAFTDVVTRGELDADTESLLASGMQTADLGSAERYIRLLEENGCTVLRHDDMSEQWKQVLTERLAMYRALRDTTVAKFGQARHDEWDSVYSHFVSCFVENKLGGVRIIAQRQ